MQQIEEWMRKHPNATMQTFYSPTAFLFVVRFYDTERGNHIAGGGGRTFEEALLSAYAQAEKV